MGIIRAVGVTWFERLVGFPEDSPEEVRSQLVLEGTTLRSLANGASYEAGTLEIPSLAELRERVRAAGPPGGRIAVRQIVGEAGALHRDPANAGALFQVASQFNLLEMVGPDVTPEMGVGRYEGDPTQGPACAIAAGAGTIHRNYLVEVEGRPGQAADRQIDCLADLGRALGNTGSRLWKMQNGYAMATREGLREIAGRLRAASPAGLDRLRGLLRIGLQLDTEVTTAPTRHTLSQAYCSALPVAYGDHPRALWEPFARLILEAAYEATLAAAVLNARRTGNPTVFLTLLGGGAFGNDRSWILDALRRALRLYRAAPLRAVVVARHHPTACCSDPSPRSP